jgi:predicted DCC family thiol-disulfide oxidoreductase YuxK
MENPFDQSRIVFFDGICILCNRSVDFILKRDRKKRIKFASLQSGFANDFLHKHQYEMAGKDSIIFFENGKIYSKSSAVIKIAGYLGFPWFLARSLYVIPLRLRDTIYDYIARNRYRWFGRRETCRMPDKETEGRIIAPASSLSLSE